ncbi:MAG TPA: S9 family peptidase [Candidatus Sulfotelmatobacter sp.]|nr:S9 family peptidase [Candidatus Sulfotelmatobacter sp.]
MRCRVLALATGLVFAMPALAGAVASRPLHQFAQVAIAPDGMTVADVESVEAPPDATAPPVGTLVVRSLTGGAPRTIACPGATACRISAPTWSPDGRRLAYLVRDEKAGTTAVWSANGDGSDPKPWLSGFTGILNAPRWAPDGSTLALLATANAHKEIGATQAGAALTGDVSADLDQDVQRIAVLGGDATLRFVSPDKLFVYEYDWAPDGHGFAATGAYGNGDDEWWVARLYAIGIGGDAHELLRPAMQMNAPRISPDGKSVAFIGGLMSDFGSVGGDVYVMPLAGGRATDVTPGITASVTSIAWRPDGKLTITALVNDRNAIETLDPGTGATTMLWSAPEAIGSFGGDRVALSRDASRAAFAHQDFEHPPEIAAGPMGRFADITHDNDGIAPLTHARSITWTNEGFHAQGWLLAPLNAPAGKKSPMIVVVHGGPSAAAQPSFITRGQLAELLAHGYYLFEPNPRGSYGQGERFTAANVKDFGYGDLRDILAGVDAAEKVAPIDDARLGIQGFSYGGYMTMWAVTQTHRFKAAAAGAGIANWQSYYGENGIDEWMIPFFGASVYADPAVYARSSPITYITNVRTPTFVFVGERDVECPAPQSLEFWHALHTLGVPSSLVIYPGEGHGIRLPAHQRDFSARILAWFDKYLAP